MSDVDLTQLAIDRSGGTQRRIRPGGRHVLTRYVLPAGLFGGVLALLGWAARDAVLPPRPVTVVPVLVSEGPAQPAGTPLFNAAGWVEPRPTPIRVAALAPGVVAVLLVVEDQPVKAGEPVAELVKDDARLEHDRAQADLRLREAELAEVQAAQKAAQTRREQPVHLEAALGEAEAVLAKTETELKNLPFELRRAAARFEYAEKDNARKIAAGSAVSGQALDAARAEVEAAEALVEELELRESSLQNEQSALARRRDALRRQLELLTDEIRAAEEAAAQVEAAEARVEQARVVLAEAALRLERMTVRAPVDGRVYRLIGHPGSSVGGGRAAAPMSGYDDSTIVTMYQPDRLQVRADVRFENIPQVSLGQPVEINNPALDSPLSGEVLFLSAEANIQKNTLEVKVAIDAPPRVFKPEMLVDVTFLAATTAQQPNEAPSKLQLYIPQQLIERDDAGSAFVWVADQSAGVAQRTAIETGFAVAGGLVEITSGLNVASKLIVQGRDGLQNGARIRITGEDAVAAAAAETHAEAHDTASSGAEGGGEH